MSEEEFLALFARYRPMVYALALSYTRSPQDAEDVCQTTFLRLLERPPAPGKERAWLAAVAANHCKSLLRSPDRRRRAELSEDTLAGLTFAEPEEQALWIALGELSPQQRALIHLRFYEGFTVAELARQYKTVPGVISARLYRAKQQLKQRLEEAEHGETLSEHI